MWRTFAFISRKQWALHQLRLSLTIAGILLGVAVPFAIRIGNIALLDSLKTTVEKLAGKATLQVTAGESGFPEEVLDVVRSTPGVTVAAPVIEVVAHMASGEDNLLILGIEAAGDQSIRPYQFDESSLRIGDPLVYLAQPNSILITRMFAKKRGLKENDPLPLYTSQGRKEFVVRGLFKPIGAGEAFDDNLAVMDIYSAQSVFDRGKKFDRIDLVTDPSTSVESVREALSKRLPQGFEVNRPSTRRRALENYILASSWSLNLTGFIALLVAVFIVFNSFTISVNQRWKEIGILRALGATRAHIQAMILGEAAVLGLIGSILGLAVGYLLAQTAARITGHTVMSLYGLSEHPARPIFRFGYALASLSLGVLMSLIATWLPARAASRRNPVPVLHDIEIRQPDAVFGFTRTLVGLAMLGFGLALTIYYPPQADRTIEYAFAVLMFLGLILLLPQLAQMLARALRPIMGQIFGSEGLLAVDTMIYAPRRTSATIAALMIGLMLVFSMGAYVQSYKRSLVNWMNHAINADIFVKASNESVRSKSYHLSESLGWRIADIAGVRRVGNVRMAFVPYQNEEVALISMETKWYLERVTLPLDQSTLIKAIRALPEGKGVLISDNLAARFNLGQGDSLTLQTPTGPLERPVLAVVEDYSSEKGSILMDRELYASYWRDRSVDLFDVTLQPGTSPDLVKTEVQKAFAGAQRVFVFTNREYKKHIMGLTDRLLLITYWQILAAILVTALGIINTLVISVSERRRDIGLIRAIGGLSRQVRKLVLLEALSIAIVGTILGALAGVLNTLFLTRTMAMTAAGGNVSFFFPTALILLSPPVIIAITFAAAWWPAQHAVRLRAVEAISYE